MEKKLYLMIEREFIQKIHDFLENHSDKLEPIEQLDYAKIIGELRRELAGARGDTR